jgi:hypothetical protein
MLLSGTPGFRSVACRFWTRNIAIGAAVFRVLRAEGGEQAASHLRFLYLAGREPPERSGIRQAVGWLRRLRAVGLLLFQKPHVRGHRSAREVLTMSDVV